LQTCFDVVTEAKQLTTLALAKLSIPQWNFSVGVRGGGRVVVKDDNGPRVAHWLYLKLENIQVPTNDSLLDSGRVSTLQRQRTSNRETNQIGAGGREVRKYAPSRLVAL